MQLAATHSQKVNDMIVAQHAIDAEADGVLTGNEKHFRGIKGLTTFEMR